MARAQSRARRSPGQLVKLALELLFLLLLVGLLLLRAFVYRPVIVNQDSMTPTLHEGDRLMVDTWAGRGSLPPRGAIVVVQHPKSDMWVVKRVIAEDGDRLDLWGDGVWVNGQRLHEPYAKPWDYGGETTRTFMIPKGQVFLLGDNRPGSQDSRDYGPVSADLVIGQAVAVFWPRDRARWLTSPGATRQP